MTSHPAPLAMNELTTRLTARLAPVQTDVASDAERNGAIEARGGELDGATVLRAFREAASGVHRMLMVRTRNDAALCDDLMQQLWLAARKVPADLTLERFQPWLRGVAKNILASHFRSASSPSRMVTADPALAMQIASMLESPTPGEMLSGKEVREQLLLALTELDSADQELLIAHYVHGQSFAVLAERWTMSERAVEGRLYRARKELRQTLTRLTK